MDLLKYTAPQMVLAAAENELPAVSTSTGEEVEVQEKAQGLHPVVK